MSRKREDSTPAPLDSDAELEGFDESPGRATGFIARRLVWMGVALGFSVVGLLILRALGG